jgi:CheY-like chemotaxis protein
MSVKVLVADDSQTIRSVAEFLLRQKECEVILAKDGEEALALIRSSSPDLLLLDNSMPLLDGYSLCQELKKDTVLKNIPVVMLLNSRETANQEDFKNTGCEDFILKPFSPREFLEKVGEYLKKDKLTEEAKRERNAEIMEIKEPSEFSGDLKDLSEPEFSGDKKDFEETSRMTLDQNSYDKFVTEFKKEMEGLGEDEPMVYQEMRLETPDVEKEEESKKLDYEDLTQRIVEEVSTKIAQKIVDKIDAQEIKLLIKERVKELV